MRLLFFALPWDDPLATSFFDVPSTTGEASSPNIWLWVWLLLLLFLSWDDDADVKDEDNCAALAVLLKQRAFSTPLRSTSLTKKSYTFLVLPSSSFTTLDTPVSDRCPLRYHSRTIASFIAKKTFGSTPMASHNATSLLVKRSPPGASFKLMLQSWSDPMPSKDAQSLFYIRRLSKAHIHNEIEE